MDPFVIVAIITGITALVTSVLTHIRYSSCWGIKFFTRSSKNGETTPLTPSSPISN